MRVYFLIVFIVFNGITFGQKQPLLPVGWKHPRGFKCISFSQMELSYNKIEGDSLTISSAIEIIRMFNTLTIYGLNNTDLSKKLDSSYFKNEEKFNRIFTILKMQRIWSDATLDSYSKEFNIYLMVPPLPPESFYELKGFKKKWVF